MKLIKAIDFLFMETAITFLKIKILVSWALLIVWTLSLLFSTLHEPALPESQISLSELSKKSEKARIGQKEKNMLWR